MNIPRISNTSFGRFADWNTREGVVLSDNDIEIMHEVIRVIDQTEGRRIDVWARVAKFDDVPNKLFVKFKTKPLAEDMVTLKKYHPDITDETYKRFSSWFPIDKTLMCEAIRHLRKQNGYLKYCLNTPDHEYRKPDTKRSDIRITVSKA